MNCIQYQPKFIVNVSWTEKSHKKQRKIKLD